MPSFLSPIIRGGETPRRLENGRNGRVVAQHLMTAFDSAARRRGLLRHDCLPDDYALIIAPTNAIHTFFMRFPIDVAFVNRDGRVLEIRHSLPPWRIAAALRSFAVIELSAGALSRADTIPGDILRLTSS